MITGLKGTRSFERRGSALVIALMAAMVVSILAAGFLQVTLGVTRRQGKSVDNKQAFYLAEAGLAEAYSGLALAKTGNVGTELAPAAWGGGLFWVEATEYPSGLVELESTGMYGAGRVTLGLVAEPVEEPLTALGLFVSDAVSINPDTLIDSFDSSLGSYALQVGGASNTQAPLGSNGDITLQNGVQVMGDATAGPLGTVNVQSGASLSGTTNTGAAARALPPIEVPTLASQPGITHNNPVPLILAPGEEAFDSITVGANAKIIVLGPSTLVVGDLVVEKDGELAFDTSAGPIDCFVTGEVDLKADSLVSTPAGDTSDIIVHVASPSSKSVSFGATSQFYGFLYAPDALLKLGAKFEIFGGVIGKGMNLASHGRMHYDLAGLGTRADRLPKLHAWRVVDIPQQVANRRVDPFHAMGLDPATLKKPADAHKDQWLVLKYVDQGGFSKVYEGWESAFDWDLVSQVIAGTRDGERFEPDMVKEEPVVTSSLADLIDDSSVGSAALAAELLRAAVVSDAELIGAMQRSPAMTSLDLYSVLEKLGPPKTGYPFGEGTGPLSTEVLLAAINNSPLDSKNLSWALEQNSPLPPAVLDAALNRVPSMKTPHINTVLNAQ